MLLRIPFNFIKYLVSKYDYEIICFPFNDKFQLSSFSQVSPEPFLEEITNTFPNVRDLALSPDGNEILFTAKSVMGNLSAIVTSKKVNNSWSAP